LLELARQHGDAPMLGRTLLQPALVISVGFKLVGWVAPLVRARQRLRSAGGAALQLQLGGAVGTLSVMGERGPAVARRMAGDLRLGLAPGAWHTQRDEWVALGCEVGVLCGSLGKIAKDIALLAQGEIGELAEPSTSATGAAKGGSSAMPHKRNPVASMIALAASMRAPHRVAALLAAMPQEHERGLGNWQAELAEWPGLFLSAHGAVEALAEAAAGLTVDAARMRRNIDALNGLVFAEAAAMLFARPLGKAGAQALLEALSREAVATQRPLLQLAEQAVAANAALGAAVDAAALRAAFDVDAAARQASAAVEAQWADLRERAAAFEAVRSDPSPKGTR
jgi:3-carboxy-cis,cis-muconate cycloisomerase